MHLHLSLTSLPWHSSQEELEMAPTSPPDPAATDAAAPTERTTSETEEQACGEPRAPVSTEDPPTPAIQPRSSVATTTRSVRRLSSTLEVLAKTKFFEVFGRLGVPMVATLMLSALSTFFLAYIQVYPTEVVNAVMNTEHFDNGEFWLLPYPKASITICSTVLLVLFGLGYVGLVVLMLFGRRFPWDLRPKKQPGSSREQPQHVSVLQSNRWLARMVRLLRAIEAADLDETAADSSTESESAAISSSQTRSFSKKGKQSLARMYSGTVGHDSTKYRHFYSTTLVTYLSHGFPTPLIYFYSHLLFLSWLFTVYRYRRFHSDHHFIVVRLFYLFDLFFAVFAPLVVLGYAIHTFKFDREEQGAKAATLKPGAFDGIARLYGEPGQIAVFRAAFHYLQFSTGASLFVKSVLNLLSLYKWRKVIELLNQAEVEKRTRAREGQKARGSDVSPEQVDLNLHNQAQTQTIDSQDKPASRVVSDRIDDQPPASAEIADSPKIAPPESSTLALPDDANISPLGLSIKKRPSRRLSVQVAKATASALLLSLAFFAAGAVIFVYSIVAVHSSTILCAKYPKCSVVSYQWNVGAHDCTCLVYVDRNVKPATFAEWLDPPDASADLARLAAAGQLRIVQIINRALPALPDELHRCHKLEQVILIYSRIRTIPDWAKDFHDLEYLHIEGDFTPTQLEELPPDLFSDMPHLTFLHLGSLIRVPSIPDLSRLHKVRYLTLAVLHGLRELPSFEGLDELMSLVIADAIHVNSLPSFTPLKKLKSMGLIRRNAVCCNGFVNGICDLTHFQCLPRADEELVTCTDARISEADLAVLTPIGANLCDFTWRSDLKSSAPTLYTSDTLCGGVMYKQCTLGTLPGICFSSRMQVVACTPDVSVVAMRKELIRRGAGAPCDPNVEAWLGCTG
ncbi:hypothetical protein PybrP1_001185 [[Pythium] brassicae (nom. inval.)]|nr:hypothetical protein PybrP1_001185 [[Pythium] brassicae (nom. inval.)]